MENKCYDAFNRGDEEKALRLLKVVKDPREVKGYGGSTLLHHAAVQGWTDIVELLIMKYNCDVNSVNVYNYTPVHYASIRGHLNVIKYYYCCGLIV